MIKLDYKNIKKLLKKPFIDNLKFNINLYDARIEFEKTIINDIKKINFNSFKKGEKDDIKINVRQNINSLMNKYTETYDNKICGGFMYGFIYKEIENVCNSSKTIDKNIKENILYYIKNEISLYMHKQMSPLHEYLPYNLYKIIKLHSNIKVEIDKLKKELPYDKPTIINYIIHYLKIYINIDDANIKRKINTYFKQENIPVEKTKSESKSKSESESESESDNNKLYYNYTSKDNYKTVKNINVNDEKENIKANIIIFNARYEFEKDIYNYSIDKGNFIEFKNKTDPNNVKNIYFKMNKIIKKYETKYKGLIDDYDYFYNFMLNEFMSTIINTLIGKIDDFTLHEIQKNIQKEPYYKNLEYLDYKFKNLDYTIYKHIIIDDNINELYMYLKYKKKDLNMNNIDDSYSSILLPILELYLKYITNKQHITNIKKNIIIINDKKIQTTEYNDYYSNKLSNSSNSSKLSKLSKSSLHLHNYKAIKDKDYKIFIVNLV